MAVSADNREKAELKLALKVERRIRKGQRDFYTFCRSMNPSFYTKERTFLKELCDNLQALYEGTLINESTGKPYKKLALSLPPGHGKSYTASLFSMWCFGQDINNTIITASYNEKMAQRLGVTVRDGIEMEKGMPGELIFRDFFPDVKVKYGDASKVSWTLEGRYFSFLASSFRASLTGMRSNIGIIDDPIKNAEEAFNETVLEDKWLWYTDTFLSRMLEGAIQIIIATRWATKDIIGKVLEEEPEEWYVINMPALLDKEKKEMLSPSILSYETYMDRKRLTTPEIFSANYDQQPVDIKGKLYTSFKEYQEFPAKGFKRIINYTDTADTGEDYLCSIVAGETFDRELYVLDIIYTKEGMEVTEKQNADMLHKNKTDYSLMESNNGGRGYARNVERILRNDHKTWKPSIKWFHQTQNKQARILSNSTFVMDHVYFPENWKNKFPEYYQAMNSYQKEGKNAHDDAPDATTGLAEMVNKPKAGVSGASGW